MDLSQLALLPIAIIGGSRPSKAVADSLNNGCDKGDYSPAPNKERQQYQGTENGDGEVQLSILFRVQALAFLFSGQERALSSSSSSSQSPNLLHIE